MNGCAGLDLGFNPMHGYVSGPRGHASRGRESIPGFFTAPPGMAWYDLSHPMMQGMLPPLPQMLTSVVPTCGCPPPYPSVVNSNMPRPPNDHGGFPGIHLPNVQGGTGNPWGYNYIFPQSTTVVHILKSARPPWQLEPRAIEMIPCTVPSLITVKELMKSLGCDNPDAKKNVLYEITQAGNGKWKKGMVIKGDDDSVTKSLADIGWGQNRNGVDDDYVWLYLTKD